MPIDESKMLPAYKIQSCQTVKDEDGVIGLLLQLEQGESIVLEVGAPQLVALRTVLAEIEKRLGESPIP